MNQPARVFLVGTDTDIGKTTLVCELLSRAAALGIRAMPYKPAQSGDNSSPSDAERLRAAAPFAELCVEQIVAFDFPVPVAPGIAQDARAFLVHRPEDRAPIHHCQTHLEASIRGLAPELVLIEGAGGLWVPMPGGSWQPSWIDALATHVVVVARAGLGTINHTLCTIDALRQLGRNPIGFYLVERTAPDASSSTNATVIAVARDLPHLGTLPFGAPPTSCLLTALRERL
jgi:dethiobiotin synthetase